MNFRKMVSVQCLRFRVANMCMQGPRPKERLSGAPTFQNVLVTGDFLWIVSFLCRSAAFSCTAEKRYTCTQGLYKPWKTWKVMEFDDFIFPAWKVMEFRCGSWKIMQNDVDCTK